MQNWRDSQLVKLLATILRLYLGYNWTVSGYGKVFGASREVWVGSQAGVAITGFLKGALAKTSGAHPDVQSWYAWFINHFALPNAKTFSYLVASGEFLTGIALILGVCTTLALLASLLMNFNYLLAGSVSLNPIFIIEALILLWLGRAAYFWAVDRWLLPRLLKKRFADWK
jgi:thiosulfate dehydrogenase (quinone) large subunit